MKPTGDRGAAYIRVSHGDTERDQRKGEDRRHQDPTAQRTMSNAWAARHGKHISGWYEDTEGRNPRDMAHKRDHFQRLLRDVAAGMWDWVVVDSQDRIDPADAAEMGHYIYLFRQADCELWSVDSSQGKGGLLTSTDIGAVFTTTASSVTSAADLKERGKRQVSRKREHAARGDWQGGYVPYGFDVVCLNAESRKEVWRVVVLKMVPKRGVGGIWQRVIVYPDGRQERCDGKDTFPKKQDWEKLELAPSIITERVETVQEIFRLFASGAWSVRGLAQRLNQRQIDPVNGVGWYHTRLKPMLQNPAYYVGQTVYYKQSHGKNAWFVGGEYLVPPKKRGKTVMGRKNDRADWVFPKAGTAIITKDQFDQVQARLDGKPIIKRGLRDERLWLAGLVVCDRCGCKMSGRSQGGLSYYCTTYTKYGKENAQGCRLHKVSQDVIEAKVVEYLEEIAGDVRALAATEGQPALLGELMSRLDRHDREFDDVLTQMKQFLAEMNTGELVEAMGINLDDERSAWAVADLYRRVFDRDREQIEEELAEASGELRNLLGNLNRIPAHMTEAVRVQQGMIEEADLKVRRLREKLVPLDEKLEAAYVAVCVLDGAISEAEEAMKGDDARRKALALRKVVSEIRLSFRHFDHVCRDRRSKSKTAPRSTLERVEIVPVQGERVSYDARLHASTVDRGPGPIVHVETLLRAVLSRVYAVQPTGNGRASLITPEVADRIRELHGQGKSFTEIGNTLGLGRKQVRQVVNGGHAASQ